MSTGLSPKLKDVIFVKNTRRHKGYGSKTDNNMSYTEVGNQKWKTQALCWMAIISALKRGPGLPLTAEI